MTATDATRSPRQTFTYSHDFEGVGGTCTNTTTPPRSPRPTRPTPETVTVCVGLDLTVTKTAAGTFDRTYLWEIIKDVDKTTVNIAKAARPPSTTPLLSIRPVSATAGWTLSGKITMCNPNDWEDITVACDAWTTAACAPLPGNERGIQERLEGFRLHLHLYDPSSAEWQEHRHGHLG